MVRYTPDVAGRLVAPVPDVCPFAEDAAADCTLWVDHYRERKTGPCFPLAVARCGVHGRAFTLYPPGHVPYGRVAIAPMTADGELIVEPAEPVDERAGAERQPDWSATLFGAALDAAAGSAWPREQPSRWRTQRRWLVRGAAVVGLVAAAVSAAEPSAEHVARQLDVPTLSVLEGGTRWRAAGGYRHRGRAIVGVLAELRPSRRVAERLLAAGAIGGLWGRPSPWDPGGGLQELVTA